MKNLQIASLLSLCLVLTITATSLTTTLCQTTTAAMATEVACCVCGQCVDGYTEDLFTTKCRDIKQCHDYWFWPVAFAYVVIMALYLVFKPPVISILSKKILWFQNQNHDQAEHHFNGAGYIKIVFTFIRLQNFCLLVQPKSLLRGLELLTQCLT